MTETVHVLHAEDDPDFAELTATYLQREDERFSVTSVRDARSARSYLAENPVDCIVSDHDMPGQNGIELLQAVRDEFPDLPFILFTGKGSEAVASEGISAGVTDYLQKETGTEQFKLLGNRITTAVANYRRQHKIERQSALFKKTQNLADIGAWEHNPVEGEVHFSDQIYEIYSVDSDYEPHPETDIERFYHPEDRDTVRAAINKAHEVGEPYDIEVRLTAADGTEKWIRTTGEPQFEDGECVRIRGTIQDITERKEREQRLESEREFIQKSLNTLDDIFYLVDPEGNFQRWNQTLPELTGYTDEEIGSMNALEFFDGEHREAIESAIHEILQTGSNVTEAAITTRDGRHIEHEFRGVRMTDDAGNPTGIIGIARDITARKEREADLKAERDRLDEFASIISHDLRNPLTIASGRLELAQAECDSDHLDDVAAAIDRSQTLIQDILRLARSGDTIGTPEPVPIATLVEDCWGVIPAEAATLNVETSQTVSADRSSLRQLVENLLANAVEHGGEDVAVRVGDLPEGFYIGDDGVGIPEEEHEKIFEAGYSLTEETTGFGLGIVKQIVDAHGWEIRVVDSDDGGTRVEITGMDVIE
jgi:PAS domain S-box-containing protein